MGRKLNREELLSSNPLLAMFEEGPQLQMIWRVYDEYAFQDFDTSESYHANGSELTSTVVDVRGDPYVEVLEDARVLREYQPLVGEPDLFLKFARQPIIEITDGDISHTHSTEWYFKYGLLGLQQQDLIDLEDSEPGPEWVRRYSDRGGPEEKLKVFGTEVTRANWLLVLYEAALSKDAEKLEEVLFSHSYVTFVFPELSDYISKLLSQKARVVGGTRAALLADVALQLISVEVSVYLDAFTYPHAIVEGSALRGRKLIEPDSLSASLQPRNLLGAMYLQFYWLITSARELSRCEQCNRLITHGPPPPGSRRKRKTYSNKRFCNDSCRQKYHYHKRVKPARKSNRPHR